MAAQATQTAGLIAAMGVDCYTAWVRDESFVERVARPTTELPTSSLMIE